MAQGFLNRNMFKAKETIVNDLKAFASDTITIDGSVKTLDLTGDYALARAIHVYVDSGVVGKALRYTYDGTTPTSTLGIARQDNDEFILTEMSNLEKFRVTQVVAGVTSIFITYLK
jgi:hypothetical protein